MQVLTAKNGEEGNKATGPGKGSQAKELLKRYGSAYLITSISLSVVSFGLCYLLVSAGVDVAALLQRIGIDSTSTSEKVRGLVGVGVVWLGLVTLGGVGAGLVSRLPITIHFLPQTHMITKRTQQSLSHERQPAATRQQQAARTLRVLSRLRWLT
jgi:hypothetical protein